jgi:hypothetical protein
MTPQREKAQGCYCRLYDDRPRAAKCFQADSAAEQHPWRAQATDFKLTACHGHCTLSWEALSIRTGVSEMMTRGAPVVYR